MCDFTGSCASRLTSNQTISHAPWMEFSWERVLFATRGSGRQYAHEYDEYALVTLCLLAYLLASVPACSCLFDSLLVSLFDCFLICLFSCLLVYLFARLLVCWFSCLLVCLFARAVVCLWPQERGVHFPDLPEAPLSPL